MHMADALVSPAVGGAMWAATGLTIGWCAKKVREELDDRKVPLMGVLGAFIFAAQMINFTIPGTGSSGHLGGGMILSILLGPYAAFIVIASVITVQALFFADGGLLALGCNIFNMGAFPAFVAYPLLYRRIAGRNPTPGRIAAASLFSAVVSLQLGAFAVVVETVLSGISALPFGTFVALMQPIHLGIGIVEGLVTAAVVTFVWKAQPGIVGQAGPGPAAGGRSSRKLVVGLGLAALIIGGALSWFASVHPDGLEWSIAKITGKGRLPGEAGGLHGTAAGIQRRSAILPGYGFNKGATPAQGKGDTPPAPARPVVDAGRSLAGIVGGAITLAVAVAAGFLLRKKKPR